ncbi:MAG: amidase [Dehalococcoidia bacterium]|nr:amidase [Dehalococcoidia bacterium]
MDSQELCWTKISELSEKIKSREVSVKEIIERHIKQIEKYNPEVNAVVTTDFDRALATANKLDATFKNHELPLLFGIPVLHKDLVPTKDLRTTYGSPLYKDNIPEIDGLIVQRLKEAGAVTLGKTNTPEFGAGSQTFNQVFGATLNPYDLTKTCGGSSGGSAVALACGMTPIADGGDLGGSLRNPANFCNVIGFRTSVGRVPTWPSDQPWSSLSVQGPMARNIEDLALMLTVISGPDSRAPVSLSDKIDFSKSLTERSFKNIKISWSVDFDGLPVDGRTKKVIESHKSVFEELGFEIDEICPDFSLAREVFETKRAYGMATSHFEKLTTHRDQLKDTVIWNTEEGLKLSALDLGRAEVKQAELFETIRSFMETYEFMIFPVSQVPPFPVTEEYVKEINGHKMENYIDWMKSCYYITATGHPAISVPCGFTEDGLPVGIQIVGRYRQEASVLQLAKAFEDRTEYWKVRPNLVQV